MWCAYLLNLEHIIHGEIYVYIKCVLALQKCQNRKCGTKSRWYSQPFLKDNRGILLANFKLAMSIPLSGNYYSKISLLLKFMGLQSVASQTYYSIQAHYVQPTVDKEWRKEQHKLSLQMAGKALVVAGMYIFREMNTAKLYYHLLFSNPEY